MIPRRDQLERMFYASPRVLRAIVVDLEGRRLARRRFSGPFSAYREWLEDSQWWDPAELRAFQEKRLQRILTAAACDVPYFRSLFANLGIDPAAASLRSLDLIPVLTKSDIRQHATALRSETVRRRDVSHLTTSGTTGHHLAFALPKAVAYALPYALLYRFYRWAGVQRGDRRVTLGGRLVSTRPPYWVHNRAEHQLLMSVQGLNEATVDRYIALIRSFSPAFIAGHPTPVAFVATRLLDKRQTIPVRAVFTTGETLDAPQRDDISRAYRCDVFESYGLREQVIAAFECEEHKGLHEAAEFGVTEIVPRSTGMSGLIGTSLWNHAMPFIRYGIDDLVEPSSTSRCPCGRGLPLRFTRVLGRTDDVLRTPEGRTILPVAVRTVLKGHLLPFETYQVQQLDRRTFKVILAGLADDPPVITPRREQSVRAMLLELLGPSARIQIVAAPRIDGASLKTRNVVNLFAPVELR